MADNLQILIDAILTLKDTTASKEEIKKNIPTLNNQLANDKNARVNIVAGLDISKTKQLINTQLATIGKDIKINIGNINVGAVQAATRQIQSAVSSINNSMASVSGNGVLSNGFTKTFDNTKNALELAKQEFSQFNNVASVSGNWIKGVNGNLTGFTVNVKNTAGAIENFKYRLEEINNVKAFFFQGSTGADSGILKLSQDIENAKAKYERLIADFKSTNSAIISGLSQPLADVESKLNTLGKGTGINELTNAFERLKTSASEITKYLATTNSSFNKSTNAVNSYRDMDATLTKLTTDYNNLITKNTELGTQIANAKNKLSELQAIESQSGTNAEWAKKYQLVNAEIKSIITNLQLTQKAESADKNSVAQQQLKYYGKIREEITLIQNLKNKLSNAGNEEAAELERQITNAKKRIGYDEQQIQKKKLYNETLLAEVNTLKNVYAEQDKVNKARQADKNNNSAVNLTNEISVAKSSLAALEQKWQNQGLLTGEFKAKVDQLKVSLSQVGTADGLKEYRNELKNITNQAKLAVVQNTNLSTKIKTLNSDIIVYQNNNQKAMKSTITNSGGLTFARQLDDLRAKLKICSNPADYRKIAANFRMVQSDIKAMGLTGDTVFGKLIADAKKFGSWMGITTVISRLAMNVRNAVNELKEIDTILTEISKTSDRTSDSLERLGKSAFDAASKYGQKASDYLLGVQEMSRAGFDEKNSEQMASLSTLAQSAGDMTAELANEYLIATNAAYQYSGNAEKLNAILDSQNYLTNHNAVNMTELANATKIAGSQAAQSGIGIDEMTAAVGTMIATTQQGGETAGRAFKGILMNLQLVKAEADEIGDGGEAITTESLTKYEKACEDLGVSLKEVKNNVWTLRKPMEVLNELAEQFNKEADDSVKKANLISAIGGKYRGNQLTALLSNWDTYKKMLTEYNSSEAKNSAFEEAMKTADSWEGKLNTLSNTWTEFTQNFVTTDFAKGLLDTATTFVDILEKITDDAKALPVLFSAIGAVMGARGTGGDKKTSLGICPSYTGGNTEQVYAEMVA